MDSEITFMEKYIIPFIITIVTYFSPTYYWFGAIGFFIAADLLVKLFMLKRDNIDIESRKLWRTAYKFGMGGVFLIVGFMCQKLFVPDLPVMKIIASCIIVAELKSLDEKAKELTGFSLFNVVINKLSYTKTDGKTNNRKTQD